MTASAPTAIEMSKAIIDRISQAVADGQDPAAARAQLAEMLKNQGGAMADAAAAPAAAPAPEPGTLTAGSPTVTRPNGEEYHVRKIGEHDDVAAVREARAKKIFILFTGPPGTGKTAVIEAAFADGPVYTVQGSGDTDTGDFVGGYVQLPGGEFQWVDGPLIRAMEEGRPLYVDEIALVDPKALAILYGVMDGRDELTVTANPERGTVKAKEGFYVVAACNPNAPGAQMSEALVSRFGLQVEVTTDYNLAKRMGVEAKMVTAAQNMWRKVLEGTMEWAPQLRELIAFRDVSAAFGRDVALRNMVMSAPEIDRDQVQDLVSRGYSKKVSPLRVE